VRRGEKGLWWSRGDSYQRVAPVDRARAAAYAVVQCNAGDSGEGPAIGGREMGKVILFAQQKGGAGKTMLLTQLAVCRAASGARIGVIDLDPQRTTAAWFAERRRRGRPGRIELLESADWRARTDIRDAAPDVRIVIFSGAPPARPDEAGDATAWLVKGGSTRDTVAELLDVLDADAT